MDPRFRGPVYLRASPLRRRALRWPISSAACATTTPARSPAPSPSSRTQRPRLPLCFPRASHTPAAPSGSRASRLAGVQLSGSASPEPPERERVRWSTASPLTTAQPAKPLASSPSIRAAPSPAAPSWGTAFASRTSMATPASTPAPWRRAARWADWPRPRSQWQRHYPHRNGRRRSGRNRNRAPRRYHPRRAHSRHG